MSQSLDQDLAKLRKRARRIVLIHGVGFCVVIVVATAFLVAMADYLIRFQDPGVRLICSAFVVGMSVWAARRFAWPAIQYAPSAVQVARRVERLYPQLQERLSSTIEFLAQSTDEPTAGSAQLRRAVAAETASLIDEVDMNACLDTRAARRAMAMGLLVFILVAIFGTLDSNASVLAARRLVMPWAELPWPRKNRLRFDQLPERLGAGQDFEVELFDDNGNLPDEVTIFYWFDGQPESDAQPMAMSMLNDRMVHRLDNVSQSFRVRAEGGDDGGMDWHSVEVIAPPEVEEVQIELFPPSYTGWQPAQSGSHIRALEGTRVALTGRATLPLKSVELQVDGSSSLRLPLTTEGNRFSLAADAEPSWVLGGTGRYGFGITDHRGIPGGQDTRWEVRSIKDAEPSVTLEMPLSDTFVTAAAVVPVKAAVKDDLAIHVIALRFNRSDASELGEQAIPLFNGPAIDELILKGNESEVSTGETRIAEYRWDLATLPGLEPGVRLELHVAADDYKPQTGRSSTRRLTIITRDELDDRIAQRQASILAQLAEVLRTQRTARSQVAAIEIQLTEVGQLTRRDLDQMHGAELSQRQVGRLLTDPGDGVREKITRLLSDIENNRLDTPEIPRRMNELLRAVDEISRDLIPAIARDLLGAVKETREVFSDAEDQQVDAPGAVKQLVADAGQGQEDVIARLEALLDEYSQWDNYRRFARDISRIRRDQQALRDRTDEQRLATLARPLDDLTNQQRANLKRLARDQTDLARRFEKSVGRMEQMQRELGEGDPLAAATLADAIDTARRLAISGQMREGSRSIERNQMGQAAESQQEVAASLSELMDVLANRREHELGRILKKLNQAGDELKDLRQRHKELRRKMDEAAKSPDEKDRLQRLQRLARQEREIADQVQRLARRLNRLQAQQAGDAAGNAAGKMNQAADGAGNGDGEAANENAERADRLLEEAQQQLEQRKQQAERDLLQEQMTRLEQALAGLIGRQQGLLGTTREIDETRGDRRPNRDQLASVHRLGDAQRMLAADTGEFTGRVSNAEVFVLALRGAIREMIRAAGLLEQGETGEDVQQAEHNAANRLEQLRTALKPDPDQPPNDNQDQQNQSGDQAGNQGQQGVRGLAELKLLKLLQEEINRRTLELEEVRKTGELTATQQRELDELAEEQGRLADMVFNLVEADAANPEDNPADLPEPQDDQENGKDVDKEDGSDDLDAELLKDLKGIEDE